MSKKWTIAFVSPASPLAHSLKTKRYKKYDTLLPAAGSSVGSFLFLFFATVFAAGAYFPLGAISLLFMMEC
jgi:hypothetical protein